MSFQVLPAIDLRRGRVVRLRQGDYARETVFPFDPLALAQRYASEGARWLHVVDLDGARGGTFENLAAIESIARTGGVRVQAGGGVRAAADVARLFDAGVERVVLGSVAVWEPRRASQWLRTYGAERVVLALDARREGNAWCLPVHGWAEASPARLDALVAAYVNAGVRHIMCTDIDRDGTLAGFNLTLYEELRALAPGVALQASGGARSLDDIRAARAAGADAVILGRALLEGRFGLPDALRC